KAGIDTTGVTFVAADFEQEDWLAKLVAAGFNASQPALFIWEGVTPYLDREAVQDTLRKIAGIAAGTSVAFDHFTAEVLESNALLMRSIRASLSAGGEPLKFGIDSTPPLRDRVAELLQSCGLSLVEQRTLGQETDGKRAWGGFVIAIVK
ncbi:MAG TPA: class I SAM-dependent methyltransferase, partial [Anaerolineae bacterium]|nr:class I SAM-dependent methyltransferase [Anaerolineae bacterium]